MEFSVFLLEWLSSMEEQDTLTVSDVKECIVTFHKTQEDYIKRKTSFTISERMDYKEIMGENEELDEESMSW